MKRSGQMKQTPVVGIFAGAAFCTAALLAAAVLSIFGTGTDGLRRALQVTARFSFLLFWLAYAGGALKTLFGSAFQPIAWRGREFGLAYASAHLIHVGLVVWLYQVSEQPPVSPSVFWFFSIGLFWTYLLALLSIRRLAQALGRVCFRILRFAGMEYISFAFLVDFVGHPLHADILNLILYVPFAILSVLGTFLRLTGWASRGASITKSA